MYQSQRLLYSKDQLEVRKLWQVSQGHHGFNLRMRIEIAKRQKSAAKLNCKSHIREGSKAILMIRIRALIFRERGRENEEEMMSEKVKGGCGVSVYI